MILRPSYLKKLRKPTEFHQNRSSFTEDITEKHFGLFFWTIIINNKNKIFYQFFLGIQAYAPASSKQSQELSTRISITQFSRFIIKVDVYHVILFEIRY